MKRLLFILLILSIPVSLYALTQERELFYQAETQYFAKNYVVALETYREFVKRYPLSDLIPDAQYHRAVCLYHIKRYDESLRLFDLIEKKYRSTRFIDYVPFWKGVIFFDTGRFQLSRENLEIFLSRVEKEGKIEKGRPFVPEALMYLTRSNIETGNYREARDSMAKLVEVKGYEGLTQYETVVYSHILFKLRDFKEFGRLCRTVDLEDYPPDYRNFIILPWAEMYWETGKLDEAKKLYEMLLDASDEIASIAYQRLYSIAQRSQDFSTMEAVGRQAELKLQDYPGVIGKLWVGLGIENYRRGDYPKAEFFLQKAWEKRSDPGTHTGEEVPVYLSEIFLKNEKPDEARKILEEYLKTSEKQAGVLYFRLGTLYLRNREYERASEAFANYIKRKPGGVLIPGALYLAAYCEYRTKRFNSALQYCDSFLNSIKLEESVEDIAEGIIDERVVEDVVRLKARSLIELNRLDEAELFLGLYCNKNPGSEEVRFELLKLLFKRSKYDAVVRESSSMKDDFPGLKESHPFDYLIVQYLKGLSHIALKQYGDAAKSLGEISADDVRRSEAGFILPFWMYYRAYALYRNDRVRDSRKIALEFVASYQNHELYDEALDLGGWCSYSLGDFKKAEELFTLLLEKGDKKYSERALFFKGKSLKSMGRLEEAKKCFTGIYLDRSPSDGDYGYADDALFEHAEIQLAEGEVQKAADMYLELSRRYAKSPLAEEALYKRGEVYLSKGMYAEAKGAFRHYRQSSEEGRLADASIYWEGFATEKLGEKRGALILWEDIIRSYPKSTFRPDALRAAAETYASSEDYRRALDLYTTLINEYPEYAKGINASLRLEEIRYILFGMSKREAELTALMSKSGGVRTKEGRNAMIELSRQYIQENQKIERAYQMLSQVIQQDDPETAARAGVLLGEYYFKIGDFERAGREFFQASLRNPGDRDLVAYALYHSAEMMKLAGRDKEMNELLERLNERFPGSEWSDAGKKLKETSKTAPEKNR